MVETDNEENILTCVDFQLVSEVDDETPCAKIRRRAKRLFSVDLLTLPSKIVFFLCGGAFGSYTPFLTVFFKSVGLSASQAVLINGIQHIPATLAFPVWGMLTDHTGKRKIIFSILCLGAALPLVSMPWVSKVMCPISTQNRMNASLQDSVVSNRKGDVSQPCTNVLFYVLLVLMSFASVFDTPLSGYIDTIIINAVKSISYPMESNSNPGIHSVELMQSKPISEKKVQFGKQKLFTGLGGCSIVLFAGVASDHFNYAGWSNYTPVFLIFFFCVLMLLPATFFVINKTNWNRNNDEEAIVSESTGEMTTSNTKLKKVWSMLQKFDVIFFLVTVLIFGLACAIYSFFTVLLLVEEVTSSKTKIAIIMAVSVSSVFGYFVSSEIIKILRGPILAIAVSIFSFFLRFIVLSYTKSFAFIIIIQVISSIAYAVGVTAMTEHVQQIAPREINTTMHSITQGIFIGLSRLIGNVAGGELYDIFGGRLLFRGAGIICGIWSLLMVVVHMIKLQVGQKEESKHSS